MTTYDALTVEHLLKVSASKTVRIAALEALLRRVLAVANNGNYRDGAHLGLHAHPVMDDVREAITPTEEEGK